MNRYYLSFFFCLAGLFAAIAAPVPKDRNGNNDGDILGTWDVTERTIGKAKITSTIKMQWKLESEGKLQMVRNVARGTSTNYTFRFDSSKSPMHFEYQTSPTATPYLAICEVRGDTMRICYARSGKERPTDFEPETGEYLYTFRRVNAK